MERNGAIYVFNRVITYRQCSKTEDGVLRNGKGGICVNFNWKRSEEKWNESRGLPWAGFSASCASFFSFEKLHSLRGHDPIPNHFLDTFFVETSSSSPFFIHLPLIFHFSLDKCTPYPPAQQDDSFSFLALHSITHAPETDSNAFLLTLKVHRVLNNVEILLSTWHL